MFRGSILSLAPRRLLMATSVSSSISDVTGCLTTTTTVGGTTAAVCHVAKRGNILPNGKTYHPNGLKAASMQIPLNEPMEAQINQLAKTAHQTRNLHDAAAMYDRVLGYRRQTFGSMDIRCAATLHNLGRVFLDQKQHKGAEMALIEACAIYDHHEGKSLKYADSLGLLALAYRDMGLSVEAEAAFKEALGIYKTEVYNNVSNRWLPESKVPPENPNLHPLSSVAHLLSDSAILFVNQGSLDRAALFLEEALEIRRYLYSTSAKFKPMIGQTLSKLAEVKRGLGHITQAEIYINECIDLCLESMGRDSPATAAALSSKGNIHTMKKEFREAKKCYEEACTTYAVAFGKTSPLVASELIHLGRVQDMLQEYEASERSFEKAIAITTESLGADHVQVADASMFFSAVLMKRAEHDRAIALLRDAIRIRKARIGANSDVQLIFAHQKLGDALAAKKDPEAEAHFLMAIEMHRAHQATSDSQKVLMTDCLDDLGLYYVTNKYLERGHECLQESLSIRLAMLGEDHPTVAYSYSNLGMCYTAMQRYSDAVKALQSAISLYNKVSRDSTLAIADAQHTLGQCYHGMKDYTEALKALELALNGRRTQGEVAEVACAETLHAMCKVRLDMGDFGEAATLLAEAQMLADRYPSVTQDLRNQFATTRLQFQRSTARAAEDETRRVAVAGA